MRRLIFVSFIALAGWTASATADAHCQMPCGIYNDQLRVDLLSEHADTIEKSMKQIVDLSKKKPVNYNQIARWVDTKEHHADEVQEIVSQYFMTQRIALDDAKYAEKIKALHEMLIYAMKCKQTTDLGNVAKLRDAIKRFSKLYFAK